MDDFNHLINLRYQMGSWGSLESILENHIPNATKCLTWNAVEESHMTRDDKIVVKIEDTYGMLILLAGGLLEL